MIEDLHLLLAAVTDLAQTVKDIARTELYKKHYRPESAEGAAGIAQCDARIEQHVKRLHELADFIKTIK